jgi:tRNA dimethylallyltransferase
MEGIPKMILPVILGPTCTGKTSLALKIAQKVNADILSIDSRQVFKKLDIGTGKFKDKAEISKFDGYWEIDGIKIYGYDLLELNQELNVIKYCEYARSIIENHLLTNKKLILTCGTGFYLDFLMGNIKFNEIDSERKAYLNALSLEDVQKLFRSFESRLVVDEKNKVRLITAILNLENPKAIKHSFKIDGVEYKVFRVTDSREELFKNADNFAESIISEGVIAEFTELYKEYGPQKALDGLIYSDIAEYVSGKLNKNDLLDKIKFSLHAYIRRQETYFKKIKIEMSISDRNLIAEKITNLF